MRRFATSARANAAVITCLLLTAIMGFAALGVDLTWMISVGRELRTSSDNSALAGAWRVRADQERAREIAQQIAGENSAANAPVLMHLNEGNDAAGDIVLGYWDGSTFAFPEYGWNAVKTVSRRTEDSDLNGPLALWFANVLGISTVDIQRHAIAMIEGSIGEGIITLCPNCDCAFRNSGTPLFDAGDASIYVNSFRNHAACGIGDSDTVAAEINITGGEHTNGQARFWGDVTEGADPIPDPLADLDAPSIPPPQDPSGVTVNGNETIDIVPGYYPDGITQTNGILTAHSGIYVVGGAGITINGGTFVGEEVMFYIDSGGLDIGGNAEVTITPPTSGTYTNISFFQARGNDTGAEIIGNPQVNIQGVLYFPDAEVEIGGTPLAFGNQIIAWTIWIHGNAEMNIDFNGFGEDTRRVYLVQ